MEPRVIMIVGRSEMIPGLIHQWEGTANDDRPWVTIVSTNGPIAIGLMEQLPPEILVILPDIGQCAGPVAFYRQASRTRQSKPMTVFLLHHGPPAEIMASLTSDDRDVVLFSADAPETSVRLRLAVREFQTTIRPETG
ncbi:MAG: hypothetical protein HYY50_01755 [Candidatus Kerfeldbacteria bacterium]|nr:hypothetical protein [Candidatus Kerfeldbacteria bacterium]